MLISLIYAKYETINNSAMENILKLLFDKRYVQTYVM